MPILSTHIDRTSEPFRAWMTGSVPSLESLASNDVVVETLLPSRWFSVPTTSRPIPGTPDRSLPAKKVPVGEPVLPTLGIGQEACLPVGHELLERETRSPGRLGDDLDDLFSCDDPHCGAALLGSIRFLLLGDPRRACAATATPGAVAQVTRDDSVSSTIARPSARIREFREDSTGSQAMSRPNARGLGPTFSDQYSYGCPEATVGGDVRPGTRIGHRT